MRTVVEKLELLKDETVKKRFRIIKRSNKDSPAAYYGCIYRTYRAKDIPYPVNDTIVVFSQRLRDPLDMQKVMEDCLVWGRNHGETHIVTAAKPLIEEYFSRKQKRDEEKTARYNAFMQKMGISNEQQQTSSNRHVPQ